MRIYFLPAVYLLFASMSVLTLSSIAPDLAPKQFLFFVIGGIIFYLAAKFKFENIERLSLLGYLITIGLLLLTLILGLQTRGTSRWIDIGGLFRLQPSQLAIPFAGLMAARFLKGKTLSNWKSLLGLLGIIALPAALIFVEPDLGTSLVYAACLSVLVYFSDIKLSQVAILATTGLVIAAVGWFFLLQPYQKARITSFTSTSEEATAAQLTSSYNARQSLIAVGSGQIVGRGPGQGVQSHLRFLPERQTDFIYASLAEEFGFIGSSLIISLYLLIFAFMIYIGLNAKDKSAQLFCLMTAAMIAIQASINIGMNIGLLPITGLTLPLLSYGGSSLMTIAGMFGIVQSIALNEKKTASLHLK